MILLTGSSGFIGTYLLRIIGDKCRLVLRNKRKSSECINDQFIISDLSRSTNWDGAFTDVSCIIHLASIAHDNLSKLSGNIYDLFEVNTEGTLNFALSAAKEGVKRFVFISSIGVNGNSSIMPFTEMDDPQPIEPYATSKLKAEEGLLDISKKYDMEVVIIRPPLVYGPNAPGNFSKLIKLVKLGMPLPFASLNNKRSFVGISNLVDFIILCSKHPKAKNEIFVISDGDDISLPLLLNLISVAIGKKSWLFPCPRFLLRVLARLFGKSVEFNKLVCDLQVDISKARSLLNWNPKYSIKDELNKLFV